MSHEHHMYVSLMLNYVHINVISMMPPNLNGKLMEAHNLFNCATQNLFQYASDLGAVKTDAVLLYKLCLVNSTAKQKGNCWHEVCK